MRMRQREGSINTAVDRIKFAIRFAYTDLSTLRSGDWSNLKDDLCQFLKTKVISPTKAIGHPRRLVASNVLVEYQAFMIGEGGILAQSSTPPLPQDYEPADFLALQGELKGALETGLGKALEFPRVAISLVPLDRGDGKITPNLLVSGSTRDTFFVTLLFLLFKEGFENIAKCPECSNVFWRDTQKRKFCARPCSNLASVKAFHKRRREKLGKENSKEKKR
jgi:hypothetical protein